MKNLGLGIVGLCIAWWCAGCMLLPETAPTVTATVPPTASPSPTNSPTPRPSPTASPEPTEEAGFPVFQGEILYNANNTLRAIGADGQHDRAIMRLTDLGGGPAAISYDGRYLAMRGFNSPSVLDLQSGELYAVPVSSGHINWVWWSSDSQTLFIESQSPEQHSVHRAAMPPGSPAQPVTDLLDNQTVRVQFSGAVGSEYVMLDKKDFTSQEHSIVLLNWQTNEEQVLLEGDYVPMSASPDGSRVLLYREDEAHYAGAGTLKVFYTAELSPTEGIQNIQRVVTDDMETLFGFYPHMMADNRTIIASRYGLHGQLDEHGMYTASAVLLTPRGDGTYEELRLGPPDSPFVVWATRWNSSSTMIVFQQVNVLHQHEQEIWVMALDGSPPQFLANGANPFFVGP